VSQEDKKYLKVKSAAAQQWARNFIVACKSNIKGLTRPLIAGEHLTEL